MWLVLCESGDVSGLWAYEGLKNLGIDPLEIISSEMLSYSIEWEHRIGPDGIITNIALFDGRKIDTNNVRGVLNRLGFVHVEHLKSVIPEDRTYAIQELNALFLSWLYAIPTPVLNRPTPYGLSGRWRHESEWFWLASKSGLLISDYSLTSDYKMSSHEWSPYKVQSKFNSSNSTSIIVLNGHVVSNDTMSIPPDVIKACSKLADLSKTALLGIEFETRDKWIFRTATPTPDLRIGGKMLLEKLAAILRGDPGDDK